MSPSRTDETAPYVTRMKWTEKTATRHEATLDNLTLSAEQQGPRWVAVVLRDSETEWASDGTFETPEQAKAAAEKKATSLSMTVRGMPKRRLTTAERDVLKQGRP